MISPAPFRATGDYLPCMSHVRCIIYSGSTAVPQHSVPILGNKQLLQHATYNNTWFCGLLWFESTDIREHILGIVLGFCFWLHFKRLKEKKKKLLIKCIIEKEPGYLGSR